MDSVIDSMHKKYEKLKRKYEICQQRIIALGGQLTPEESNLKINFTMLNKVITRSAVDNYVIMPRYMEKALRFSPWRYREFIEMMEKDPVFHDLIEKKTQRKLEVEIIDGLKRVVVTGSV